MSGWESLLPFVLIVVVFWFLVVRPARKQQQRLRDTQGSATVGAEVMLGSGIYGTVAAVGDDTFEIQIAPGTTITVAKQAVVRVIERHDATEQIEQAEPDTTAERRNEQPDQPGEGSTGPQDQ